MRCAFHNFPRAAGRVAAVLAAALIAAMPSARAQLPASTSLDGFGLKIFHVESGLYPFVQVYFRTFDQNKRPLVNLNELNIGVMVKGRSYDPKKNQYRIQSIANREEGIRSVIVIDCSKTMAGEPFTAALKAAARYIDSKRPQDQVAILAIRDTDQGYEQISAFERDKEALGRRLADIRCDGNTTRLYDTIAAAMQMSAMASQGGVQSTDAQYIVSNSIVVFSDGKDEGSALSREDLNNRITSLPIPIPIYSLAYSKVDQSHLRNLEALSNNSFGIYYPIGQSFDQMQRTVEDIQNVLQNDYVVVIRSYVPIDGEEHALKVALEYPSRSGQIRTDSARFEALEPPAIPRLIEMQQKFNALIPVLPDGNPFLANPAAASVQPAEAP